VLLGVAFCLSLAVLAAATGTPRLVGDQQGYTPTQPIAFSHRLHAGEMGIDCLYCHSGAESSRHAGIPGGSTCLNCHRLITAPISEVRGEDKAADAEGRAPRRVVSDELRKLYAYVGGVPGTPAPEGGAPAATSIPWVKVHNLPNFATFDHRPHVAAGVQCQHCHGPVETMERMRQVEDLSMGWCVNCHRDVRKSGLHGKAVHPSTDCTGCHY
jgi:hypothetical protein